MLWLRLCQFLRVTEPLGWEGTSGDPLVQPLVESRLGWRRLLRAMSSQVLNICKAGHSTASLVNLYQCLTILPAKLLTVHLSMTKSRARAVYDCTCYLPYTQQAFSLLTIFSCSSSRELRWCLSHCRVLFFSSSPKQNDGFSSMCH